MCETPAPAPPTTPPPALHLPHVCLCCGRGWGSAPQFFVVVVTLLVCLWLKPQLPPSGVTTGTSTTNVHRGLLCHSCLSSFPLHWVWSLWGSLSVIAICRARDVLGAGSVLAHHPVTVTLAAPHKWAVINTHSGHGWLIF
jgi:hypothetical protein